MPACLTHYTFAVLNTPEEEKAHFDVIALGTQGSDPYFYYGILPMWSGDDVEEIRKVGQRVHHEEIGEYYSTLIDFALKSEKKEMLFAYIDALWMHYCVDRNVHPYVFARSGMDENGHLEGYYKYSHGLFEAVLDAVFARKHNTYQKTSSTIDVSEEDLNEISRMWFTLHSTFPVLKEDSFARAALAYKGVERVLWTKTGLKRLFFRLTGKHSLAMGMSYPRFFRRYDYMDVCNDQKAVWRDPVTGKESNDSMEDLFLKAKKDYEQVHAILMDAKEGKPCKERFVAFVRGINHDGEPYGSKMEHFDLAWKKHPADVPDKR